VTEIPGTALERVAGLRRAFDQVFASTYAERSQEQESLLALRIEGDLYGLNVREIAGVAVAGRLVPLPSQSPGLLGLTGIRGAVVPVYSLAVLMGYPRVGETLGWLALSGAKDPLALALGEFDGYVRVPKTALHVPDRDARKHVHQFAQLGDVVRAIISVASVVSAIQGAVGPVLSGTER
jgi:chemotaxis signal transduction protein